MKKKNVVTRYLKFFYLKLFRIHDTPQKIALGSGVGVFLGIFPGTGLIAAIFAAAILKVNRAACILGAVFTNTWLSIFIFISALKIGAYITGQDWLGVREKWLALLKAFHWRSLFSSTFITVIFPVMAGYFIIAVIMGFVVYLGIIVFLTIKNRKGVKNENKG